MDLIPNEIGAPLEDVTGFSRAIGGFGGNVTVALARLGVRVALLACVGDDGHGRYVRRMLAAEGAHVDRMRAVPDVRTPLAFVEARPPDRFPVTFYPTAAYWALDERDVSEPVINEARALVVSGTSLARDPSRTATERALALHQARRASSADPAHTVLDLDWRPALWADGATYREWMSVAVRFADVVVGGTAEFEAAGLDAAALARTTPIVVVKRGPAGVTLIERGRTIDIAPHEVEVVNGLGAGDAFIAALVAALLGGASAGEACARGNAAGAIVASRLSTSWAMPTGDEIDALLAGAPALP